MSRGWSTRTGSRSGPIPTPSICASRWLSGQRSERASPSSSWRIARRRLRAVLNPGWVSRFRRLTTQPPPFDVADLDPASASHARQAIRLHPRTGDVADPVASKLGGLFLWPAEEPWPTAAGLSVDPDRGGWGPFPADWCAVPLTPVIQINRRDVPLLAFPTGADLMQVFWCPFLTGMHAPESFVFWRHSADVKSPRREPREPATDRSNGFIPTPSRLYPEVVIEYPADDEVPESASLQQVVRAWAASWPAPGSGYHSWWNRCPGWKVGGYPWVNQSDCVRVEMVARDGRPMDYLLQVSQRELEAHQLAVVPCGGSQPLLHGCRVGYGPRGRGTRRAGPGQLPPAR